MVIVIINPCLDTRSESLTPLYIYYSFLQFYKIFMKNDVYGCNKSLAANQMLIPPMIKPIAPTPIAKIKNFF